MALVDSVVRRKLLSADPPIVSKVPAEVAFIMQDPEAPGQYQAVLRPCPPYRLGRLYLVCPSCGRSVGRLFEPQAGQVFKCRRCYRLTYLSAQTARKMPALLRDLLMGRVRRHLRRR